MKHITLAMPRRAVMVTACAAALAALAAPAGAYELHNNNGNEISVDGQLLLGVFHSEHNYNLGGKTSGGGSDWQEAGLSLGLNASSTLGSGAALFGRVSVVATGTWGDGDAGGFTAGSERRVAIEDAYAGWRSGNLFPALGEDGIEVSFGRQALIFGDGFLINGDALNMGDAIDPGLDRGGAYWLAPRLAFDKTAVLRLGGAEGLRSDVFWFESDNKAQAETEMAGVNLEYVSPNGTLGVMYLEGLDVNEEWGYSNRDGQKTLSLRAQGNAGVENLFLSGEYVRQRQGDDSAPDANAWYLEAGWTFADVTWSPSINVRHSRFEEGFDPLFFGFNRGYGTWFQGEVAANYAGPFSTDARIDYVGLKANPSETLTLGLNIFNFRDAAGGALDAKEYNLYAEWVVNDNLIISPLIGIYDPDKGEAQGGSQIGGPEKSTYAQVMVIVPFE